MFPANYVLSVFVQSRYYASTSLVTAVPGVAMACSYGRGTTSGADFGSIEEGGCAAIRGRVAACLSEGKLNKWVVVNNGKEALDRIAYHRTSRSDRGGQRAAVMYSLIVIAKMNDIDPQAWLAHA